VLYIRLTAKELATQMPGFSNQERERAETEGVEPEAGILM